MWDTFVPERGVKFGDQRFWVLVSIIGVLHAINTYRDANKPLEPDLPEHAVRRLPDGRMLMDDGSIQRVQDDNPHPHTLHKTNEQQDLLLDRAWKAVSGR
jgi:hypothetical protein